MTLIHQSDREAWLEARKAFVTASDVAALLDQSKYKTRAQLLMEKAGLAESTYDPDSESTAIGLEMEDAACRLAKKLWGWNLEQDGYLRPSGLLAATPDSFITGPFGERAAVNIKVTTAQAQEDCKPGRSGPSTARFANGCPLDYALQLQAEMACTDLQWSAILAVHCNVGFKLRAYPVRRNDIIIAKIRKAAVEFFADLKTLKGE